MYFKILSIRLRHQWQANITTEISISGCKEEVFNLPVQIQYQLIRCNYDLLLWFFEDNVSIFFPMKPTISCNNRLDEHLKYYHRKCLSGESKNSQSLKTQSVKGHPSNLKFINIITFQH